MSPKPLKAPYDPNDLEPVGYQNNARNRIQSLTAGSFDPRDLEIDPSQVDDSPGLGGTGFGGWLRGEKERFVYKNLTATPQVAQKYIEHLTDPKTGEPYYDVASVPKTYGGAGLNLFVRKRGSSDAWKPIDPTPTRRPQDFFNDITDLTADVIGGIGTTIANVAGMAAGEISGVPGGPLVGGSLASGLMAYGLERGRQKLGTMAGVENNDDPFQAKVMGVATAGIPVVGGATVASLRAVNSKLIPPIANNVAKLIGISGAAGMNAGQVMFARAKDKAAGVFAKMTPLHEAASTVRALLSPQTAANPHGLPLFQENIAKNQILERLGGMAAPGGAQGPSVHGDIRAIMDQVRAIAAMNPEYVSPKQIQSAIEAQVKAAQAFGSGVDAEAVKKSISELSPEVQKLLAGGMNNIDPQLAEALAANKRLPDEMQELARRVGLIVQDHNEDKLPVNVQGRVLSVVEEFAKTGGAYADKVNQAAAAKAVTHQADAVVAKIRQNLIDAVTPVEPEFGPLMDRLADKTHRLAILQDAFGLHERHNHEGVEKASRTIANLWGSENPLRLTLRDSERILGLPDGSITDAARRYHIGKAINPSEAEFGVPPWLPPPRGMLGLPAGFALGTWLSGGNLAGGAVGTTLGSPKVLMGGIRAASRLNSVVSEAMSKVPAEAGPAIVGAIPSLTREARPEPPKRKVVRITP